MKEQAIIIILLALSAGFESVFNTVWQKELVLGFVFVLGMYQDKLMFDRDSKLIATIKGIIQ